VNAGYSAGQVSVKVKVTLKRVRPGKDKSIWKDDVRKFPRFLPCSGFTGSI
jgi:hypothetical protein